MLKRRKAPRMNVRQKDGISCRSHIQYVNGCLCLIAGKNGHVCGGIMHPHHVRKGTHTGMSQKPDDSEVVPLCAVAHEEVHHGHDTFEAKYGVNLTAAAADTWRQSPAGIRYRMKQKRNDLE